MTNTPAKTTRGRSSWAPAIAAAAMLVVCGVAYRAAADRLGRLGEGVSLPHGTLGQVPLEIGGWKGADVALDPSVIRATDTDDLINREYRSAESGRAVALYVAYGIRLRDLAPHRPEVCYPSAGWTLQETRKIEVQGADGVPIACQVHTFRRGGLEAARLIVLNYYIVDGTYCADVSLLRSMQWRGGTSGGSYAAQVQIACSGLLNPQSAEEAVKAFAALAAPVVHGHLTQAVAAAKNN